MADTLQKIISNTPAGGTAALPAGEFEGPVTIDKPVTLRGNNSTIWARHGSVVRVGCSGVKLEGLRVEITEGELTETAIETAYPVAVRDVEVLGAVSGFGTEDGECGIPRTLQLGELSPEQENTFLMTVDIPAAAKIICSASGVRFQPQEIPAGRSDVRITVSGSGSASLVYSEILLESRFRRRIYLSGRFTAGAPAVREKTLFTASPVERTPVSQRPLTIPAQSVHSEPAQKSVTDVIANVGAAPLEELPLLEMTRGQRVPLGKYVSGAAEIYLTGVLRGNVDIDPYVFMLGENGKTPDESGLVFFGNECSKNEAVRYSKDDGHVTVAPGLVPPDIRKIVLAYSVYSGDSRRNFSQVSEPRLSVYSQGRERIRFDLAGLTDEVTLIAAELYIYHGEWRISAVGSGWRDGLVKLCARFGIEASL